MGGLVGFQKEIIQGIVTQGGQNSAKKNVLVFLLIPLILWSNDQRNSPKLLGSPEGQ